MRQTNFFDGRSISQTVFRLICISCLAAAFAGIGFAQSRDINFPSPVNTNSISGSIPARAIGDGRLTTYYYVLAGGQGDVFVNVTVKNFTGDVDIFIAGTLRPLTKMVFYADPNEVETGRVAYLRKSERMILRVEGRTPNDDEAIFRIKFAGSFVALNESEPEDPIKKLEDARLAESEARSAQLAKEKAAKEDADRIAKEAAAARANRRETLLSKPPVAERSKPADAPQVAKKPDVKPKRTTETKASPEKVGAAKRESAPKPPTVDPLADIRLVVYFKDGTKIDRLLNEVLRFSVEKGVLTIVAKDGSIGRYSMLLVDRVSVQ